MKQAAPSFSQPPSEGHSLYIARCVPFCIPFFLVAAPCVLSGRGFMELISWGELEAGALQVEGSLIKR